MTPEEFNSALCERLHRRGFSASPEDVWAFTADIGQRVTQAPDMEHWAEQFIRARQPPALIVARSPSRAGLGAVLGLFSGPVAVLIAGGIWGAMARPAPCYGGGDPDMVDGATCGVLIFGLFLGIPAAIVSAVVGALIGACFQKHR